MRQIFEAKKCRMCACYLLMRKSAAHLKPLLILRDDFDLKMLSKRATNLPLLKNKKTSLNSDSKYILVVNSFFVLLNRDIFMLVTH